LFFFEKKNQKTFNYSEPGGTQDVSRLLDDLTFFLGAARRSMVFFLPSFKKEGSSLHG
jgi:hypothetical protein